MLYLHSKRSWTLDQNSKAVKEYSFINTASAQKLLARWILLIRSWYAFLRLAQDDESRMAIGILDLDDVL